MPRESCCTDRGYIGGKLNLTSTCQLVSAVFLLLMCIGLSCAETLSTLHSEDLTEPVNNPSIEGVGLPPIYDFISGIGVSVIRDKVHSISLGSIEAEAFVPVIGTIQFFFDDVTLNGIDTSSTAASVVPSDDGILTLTVRGISAKVDCHFHYRRKPWPHVRGHGTADVQVTDGTAVLKGKVSNDGAGWPQITLVEEAQVDFPNLSVHVHDTKMAFLYNLILKIAHSHIRDAAIKAVNSEVSKLVPEEGNKLLHGLPSLVSIMGNDLNVSMVGDPEVTSTKFVQRHWGRFQLPAGTFEQCPFSNGKFPDLDVEQVDSHSPLQPLPVQLNRRLLQENDCCTEHLRSCCSKHSDVLPMIHKHSDGVPMIHMHVGQSVASCFTWVLFKRGVLTVILTPDQLPPGALSTSTWGLAFPELASKYAGENLTLRAYLNQPPVSTITQDGFRIAADAQMDFHLSCGQETLACPRLFSVNVGGNLDVDTLKFEPVTSESHTYVLRVNLAVSPYGLTVNVTRSEVGKAVNLNLQVAVRLILAAVQQHVNDVLLKDGFVLPKVPFIDFVDLDLSFEQASLLLSSNFQYSPS